MKVLMISSDRSILKDGSEARIRMIEYGNLVNELHIIIFAKRELKISSLQISSHVYLYPINSRSKWFYIFDAVKKGKKILTNDGQWLISAQDPFECGLAGWLIRKNFNVPLQLQIHTDFLSPYFKKESLLNRLRVSIAKFLIPRATCIRVVSERIKKSIVSSFKFQVSRISVLPIFVDVKKIQEAAVKTNLRKKYPQFDFIILMASRLTREKNIGLAIKAMKEITKKHPKTGLIVVGDGPEEKNYSLLITRYGLRDNIIFESWTEDIISYYKTADLFLLTSNYEGYGRTVVEAMASGCPVIMTDVGLAGEVLIDKKDGLIVPVGDGKKLEEAILKIIENPNLKADLIRNSQKMMNFWLTREKYLNDYRDSWLSCK